MAGFNEQGSLDTTTGAQNTIDYSHHEIHAGSHFKAGFQDTAMDIGDSITMMFVTPDTAKWAHFVLTTQSTGIVTVEIFEAPTTTANGTALTVWNRNRNSTKVNTTLAYHTPTVTADGTKMSTKWLGSEGFRSVSGGESRGSSEFILKQNTKYLIRLTAGSNGIKAAIGGDWYEHTNKV